MFGLFKKKEGKLSLTPEDRIWVEDNIIWLIKVFGLDHLNGQPFIIPAIEDFPYDNFNDTTQFQQMFDQLCRHLRLDAKDILVRIFDDVQSKQWRSFVGSEATTTTAGLFSPIEDAGRQRFKVEIAKSNLDKPQRTVSILAHELMHVKLLGGNFVDPDDRDMEPLTDLSVIFFGYGIFMANGYLAQDFNRLTRTGYIPAELISYANALMCYITEHSANDYSIWLNMNTNELFQRNYTYLLDAQDSRLSKHLVLECEAVFRANKEIAEGYEKQDFDLVVNANKVLIQQNPRNKDAQNSLGYGLLQQKRYEAAIAAFSRAIDIDAHWAMPYNNRGYAKLQLGDKEGAYYDIQSSFDMDNSNPYVWRNIGAYALATGDYETGLDYLQKAEQMKADIDLIHFYIGYAHLKMNDRHNADIRLEQSRAKKRT